MLLSGNVSTKSKFNASGLTANLRGAGNIYGTGVLTVNGTSDKSIVRVEGVGGLMDPNLKHLI